MSETPLREKVDMAIFGYVPDFLRASIRLSGIDPARGGRAAAAFLARAGASAVAAGTDGSRGPDDPRLAAWHTAYATVGLPADLVPPPELLAAWAAAPGGVPSQGALADLANAFSLLHRIPVAVYDLDAVRGDLWLRPSRGCEHFLALGTDVPISPALGEIILADTEEEVFARHWHGRQGRPAMAGPGARDVLVQMDLLPPATDEAAVLADAFIRLATGFLGGRAAVQWLNWDTPQVQWDRQAPVDA
jgi:DNA/RNA-binding domain of Phe-tRNA-synthetase-like protein